MRRETRHLWVGNLPEDIREERIIEYFKRYGKVQSVRILPKSGGSESNGTAGSSFTNGSVHMFNGLSATVAFIDIKSAAKAHSCENKIEERTLKTEYYEPYHHEDHLPLPGKGSGSLAAGSITVVPPNPSTVLSVSGGVASSNVASASSFSSSTPSSSSNLSSAASALATTTLVINSTSASSSTSVAATSSSTPSSISSTSPATPHSSNASLYGRHTPSRVNDDRLYETRDRSCSSSSRNEGRDSSSYLSKRISYHDEGESSREPRSRSSRESSIFTHRGAFMAGTSNSNGSRNVSSTTVNHSDADSGSNSALFHESSHSALSSSHHHSYPNMPGASFSQDNLSTSSSSHSNDRMEETRPNAAICVKNYPHRSDLSLKNNLMSEFTKYGRLIDVYLRGPSSNRYGIVVYRRTEDAERAINESKDKQFSVTRFETLPSENEVEDETRTNNDLDAFEYNHRATRTLYIYNLSKDVTYDDLEKKFSQFGDIKEIEMKTHTSPPHACVHYIDLSSAGKAMQQKNEFESLGWKMSWGKARSSNSVWINGEGDDRFSDEKSIAALFKSSDDARKTGDDCSKKYNKDKDGKTLVDFCSRDFPSYHVQKYRSNHHAWSNSNSQDYEEKSSDRNNRNYHHQRTGSMSSQIKSNNSSSNSSYSIRQRSQSPTSSPANNFGPFSSRSSVLPSSSSSLHNSSRLSKYDYHHESSNRLTSRPSYSRYEVDDSENMSEESHISSKRDTSRYRSHHLADSYLNDSSPKVRRDSSPYSYLSVNSKVDSDFHRSNRSSGSNDDISKSHDDTHRRANHSKGYHKSGHDSPPLLSASHSSQLRKSGLVSSGSSSSSSSHSPIRDLKSSSHYGERSSPPSPPTSPRTNAYSNHDSVRQSDNSTADSGKDYSQWRRKSNEESGHHRNNYSASTTELQRARSDSISETVETTLNSQRDHHGRDHGRERFRESHLHRTNSVASPSSLSYQSRSDSQKRKHASLEIDESVNDLSGHLERKKRLLACIEQSSSSSSLGNTSSISQSGHHGINNVLTNNTKSGINSLEHRLSSRSVEINEPSRPKPRDSTVPSSNSFDFVQKRRLSSSSSSSSMVNNIGQLSQNINGTGVPATDSKSKNNVIAVFEPTLADGNIEEKFNDATMNTIQDKKPIRNHLPGPSGPALPSYNVNYKPKPKESLLLHYKMIILDATPDSEVIDPRHSGHISRTKSVSRTSCDNDLKMMPKPSDPSSPFCSLSSSLVTSSSVASPPLYGPNNPMALLVPEFAIIYYRNKKAKAQHAPNVSSSTSALSSDGSCATTTTTTSTIPSGSTSSSTALTHINIPNFATSPKSINSIMSPLGNHSPVPKSRLSRDRLSTDGLDLKKSTDLDDVSDSDISPLLSTRFDEQIKALDEKYNAWSGTTSTSSLFKSEKTPTIDYSKYNIKKKSQNNLNSSNNATSNAGDESSDIIKNLLSKSSVFDQDSKRLEHINEKYEPKDISSLDLDSILSSPKSKPSSILSRAKLGSSSSTMPTEKASHLEPLPKVTSHSTPSTSSSSLTSPTSHHFNHNTFSSSSSTAPPSSTSMPRKFSDTAWTASINKKEPSSTSTLTPSTPSSAPVRSTTSSMFPQFSRSSSIPTSSATTTPTSRNPSFHSTSACKKEALVGSSSNSSISSSKVDKSKVEQTPLLKSNSIPAIQNKEILIAKVPPVAHQVSISSKNDHQPSSKLKDLKSDKLEHVNKSKHEVNKPEQITRKESERKLSDSSDHSHTHNKYDTENPSKDHSRVKSHSSRDESKDHPKKTDREKDKSEKSREKTSETFSKEGKDKRSEKSMLKEKKKNKDKTKEHREKDQAKSKGKDGKKYEGKDKSKSDREKKKDRDKHREKNKNKGQIDVADFDEPIYLSMYDKVKARSSANQSLKSKDMDGKREKLNQLKDKRQHRKDDDKNRSSMDSESDSDSSFDSKNYKQKKLVKKRRPVVKSDSSSEDESTSRIKRFTGPSASTLDLSSTTSSESCNEKKKIVKKEDLDDSMWWAAKVKAKSNQLSSEDSSNEESKSKMTKKKKKLKKEKSERHPLNDKTKDHMKMKKKCERKDRDSDKFKERHFKSEEEDLNRFMKKKKKKTKLKDKRHLKDDKIVKREVLSSDDVTSDSSDDEEEVFFNKRSTASHAKIADSDSENTRDKLSKKIKDEMKKDMFKENKEARFDHLDRPFGVVSKELKSGSQSPIKKSPGASIDRAKLIADVRKHLTSESDTTDSKDKASLRKKKSHKSRDKAKASIKKEAEKLKEVKSDLLQLSLNETCSENAKLTSMLLSPSKTNDLVSSGLTSPPCQSSVHADDASSSDSKIDELLLDDARRLGEFMSTSNTDLSLSDSNLSGTNSPLHTTGKSLHPTDLSNILPIVSNSFPVETTLDPPKPLASFHPTRSYEQEAAIQSLKLQKELETLDLKNVDLLLKPTFDPSFTGFATNIAKTVVEEHPFTVTPSSSKTIIEPEELLVVNTEVVESKPEDQTKEFCLEIDCQRKIEDDLAVAALLQDMNDPEESSTHEQSELRPTEQDMPNYLNIIAPSNEDIVMTVESVTESGNSEAILSCTISNNVIVDDQELKAAVQEIELVVPDEPKLIKPILRQSPEVMFNDDDDEIDSKLIVNEALEKSLQDDLLITDDKHLLITPIASTLTTSIEIKPVPFPLDSSTHAADTIFGGRKIELASKDKSPLSSISYTSEPPLEFRKRNSFSSESPLPLPITTGSFEGKPESMQILSESKSPVFDNSTLLSPHSIKVDSNIDDFKKITLDTKLDLVDVSLENNDKIVMKSELDEKNSESIVTTVAEPSGQDLPRIISDDKEAIEFDEFSSNNDSKPGQNKRNVEDIEHEAEGSKPKRGRRAKNRKYSDSSMHSPRSDQSSGNEQNIPPSMSSLSINTNLGPNSSSAMALLSPTSLSPNTSTTSTISDISPGSQLKRGKGQSTALPYRRSCRNASTVAEHEEENDFSHDDQHTKDDHEEEAGVKKPSKRGRKKKNSGNTDSLVKSDDLNKKDRLFPSTETRPKSSNSPYDVFEFRDDEDETLPLDSIKSSSHFNVHSHGDEKLIPEKRHSEHTLNLEPAFNGQTSGTLIKQEPCTSNVDIPPESIGQTSFNLGKEYVSEVSQHGKIAITIRLQSKDGQEMECTKIKEDSKEDNLYLTSTSATEAKGVRKSARLMSQTPKSNTEELSDEATKNQIRTSNELDKACPYKRITRSYRKSDDTQHESNEDEDQKSSRNYRITRSKGPAMSEINQDSNNFILGLKKFEQSDEIETTLDPMTLENEIKPETMIVKEEVLETESFSVIQSTSSVEKMTPVTSPIVSPLPALTASCLTPVVTTPAITSPTCLQDIPNISERIHHSSTALKLKTGKGFIFDDYKPPVVVANTSTAPELPLPHLVSTNAKLISEDSQLSSSVPVVITTTVVGTSSTLSSQSITIAPKYQPPVGQPLSQLGSAVPTTIASCTLSSQTNSTSVADAIRPLDIIQTTVPSTTMTPSSVAESMKNLTMASLTTSVVTTYQSSIVDSNKTTVSASLVSSSTSTPTTCPSVLTKASQNKPSVQVTNNPQPSHDLPHLPFNFLQSTPSHLMAPLSSEGFLAQQRMIAAAQQSSTSTSPEMIQNVPPNPIIPPFPVLSQVRPSETYEALMRNNSMLYNMASPFGGPQTMRPPISMHRFMYPAFPFPITPETLVAAEQMQQQEMGKEQSKLTVKTSKDDRSHPEELKAQDPAFYMDIAQRGFPPNIRYPMQTSSEHLVQYGVNGQGRLSVSTLQASGPGVEFTKQAQSPTSDQKRPPSKPTFQDNIYLQQLQRQLPSPHAHSPVYRKDISSAMTEPATGDIYRAQINKEMINTNISPLPLNMSAQGPPSRPPSVVHPQPTTLSRPPSRSSVVDQQSVNVPMKRFVHGSEPTQPTPAMPAQPAPGPQVPPGGQTPQYGSTVPQHIILQKYPVLWNGLLALKNDQVVVQMHLVSGNRMLADRALPIQEESHASLRITQRMRIDNQTQLQGLARKIQSRDEFCILMALPCGRDHVEVLHQSNNLKKYFITYLQSKLAAGIVNDATCGYITHIFPPCPFSEVHLERIAPDLLQMLEGISHLMVVITTAG